MVFVWCAYVFSFSFMPVFEWYFYSDTWAEFQCCESQSNHGGASFLWARSKRSQTNGQCFLQRVESSQCMAVFCFVYFFVQILKPSINKTIFIQESIVTHQFNVMLNKQVTTRFSVVCVCKEKQHLNLAVCLSFLYVLNAPQWFLSFYYFFIFSIW